MSDFQDQDSKTNGRWTKEQHSKFLAGLQLFGRNWKKIQELIGTRNGSQIRSHAQKFFLKVKKTLEPSSNRELCQESFSDPESSKIISRKTTFACQDENPNRSFFMNQIMKMTNDQPEFNFWQMLIDTGDSKNQGQSTVVYARKDSFVAHQLAQSKQQTPIDYLLVGSQ